MIDPKKSNQQTKNKGKEVILPRRNAISPSSPTQTEMESRVPPPLTKKIGGGRGDFTFSSFLLRYSGGGGRRKRKETLQIAHTLPLSSILFGNVCEVFSLSPELLIRLAPGDGTSSLPHHFGSGRGKKSRTQGRKVFFCSAVLIFVCVSLRISLMCFFFSFLSFLGVFVRRARVLFSTRS